MCIKRKLQFDENSSWYTADETNVPWMKFREVQEFVEGIPNSHAQVWQAESTNK